MNCLNITRLISREQDETLNVKQKITLAWHTAMCGKCRCYRQQIRVLSDSLRRMKSQ